MNVEEALVRVERLIVERPKSVPAHYADGCIGYLVAIGFARTISIERANALAAAAHRTLSLSNEDESRISILVFEARLQNARMGIALETPLPEELTMSARLTGELVEGSRVVAPYFAVDPWSVTRRRPPWIARPQSESERIVQLDAALSRAISERTDQLHGVLDELLLLPAQPMGELLERVLDLTATVELRRRAALRAKAVVVAEYARRLDLASESLDRMRLELDGDHVIESLGWVLPVAGRLGMRRELAELVIAVEGSVPDSQLIVAGCMAALGDVMNARLILDRSSVALRSGDPDRHDLRSYVTACTQLPLVQALDEIMRLVDRPDNSPIALVDTMVLGIVTCARGIGVEPIPSMLPKPRQPVHTPQPAVAPPRAIVAPPTVDPELAAMLEAELDCLAEVVEGPRRPTPLEAPWPLTHAYLILGFGYGLARLGRHDRARACILEARNELATRGDTVHDYLVAAYTARIEHACTGANEPEALTRQLVTLSRVEAYKVARLREGSSILDPVQQVDAIGGWITLQRDVLGFELTELRALLDPDDCEHAISALVDLAEQNDAERDRLCELLLVYARDRPEHADYVLEHVRPILGRATAPRRAILSTMALVVSADSSLNGEIAVQLARSPIGDVARIVDTCRSALPIADVAPILTAAMLRIEQTATTDAEDIHLAHAAQLGRLAMAAGLVASAQVEEAEPLLQAAEEALRGSMVLPLRLELNRALARAHAELPVQIALPRIAALYSQFSGITDSYGTNSHFCLVAIVFVESLIVAIAGLAR